MNDLMLDKATRFKKHSSSSTVLFVKAARLPAFERVKVRFLVVEPNMKRDPDGFCFGACKILLDALQHANVLQNDGWKQIAGLAFDWKCDPTAPGVLLTLIEVRS